MELLNSMKSLSEAVAMKPGEDYDELLSKYFKERPKYLDSLETNPISKFDTFTTYVQRPEEKSQLLSIMKIRSYIEDRISCYNINNDNLFSKQEEMQFCVIPIVGMGGIGKTTLAREVYDCDKVKERFELRAWVKLFGQELKLQAVAKEILKSATGMSFRLDDLDELDEIVRDTLQSHKCFIVFDEIESMKVDSWQHMKKSWFSFMGMGSKVIVTTCSLEVSDLVAHIPFKLLEISFNDADRYLRKSGKWSTILRSNVIFLSKGIPLSLKLIMGMVTYDTKFADLLSSVNLLDNVTMPNISVIILLSIWCLPWHLIQCLAFCTIFPRGYMINRQKLIEKWIAHDLIVSGTEHAGGAYFRNLLSRSFFTDVTWNEYGDIEEFRLPCLIHDFVQDVARIVFKGKVQVVDWISEDAGQLSLAYKYSLNQTSIHLLLNFKHLHTLDLSFSGIRSLSEDICALKEVKYINLSYTPLERLPDSITELLHLKTLDLSGCCYLQDLPMQMCNLTQLKHLELWLCDTLSYIPSGIGFLTSLESMSLFVLGKDDDKSVAGLGEIGSLNQLRGKLQIKNLENVKNNSEALDAKLHKKYYLRHLELSWSKKGDAANHSELLEILRPNSGLKVLHLTGYMGTKFPSWMLSMKHLTKISIDDCKCVELPSLGQLSALKELQIKRMANLESITSEFYGYKLYANFGFFPSLEQLGLYNLPRLKKWPTSPARIFPRLKSLTIEDCPQLQMLPTLPHLPDLIVCNCHENIVRSLSRFKSLSSLLINDMEVWSRYINDLSELKSLKKLIIFSNKDEKVFEFHDYSHSALDHLSILQCNKLRHVVFDVFASLRKLHILDCQELLDIVVPTESRLPLIELVIQECPRAKFGDEFFCFPQLRKMIMKSCGQLEISPENFEKLKELEYLFISECPLIENQLWMDLSRTSHVPCVILGSQKVEHKFYYEGTRDSRKLLTRVTEDSIENLGGVQ